MSFKAILETARGFARKTFSTEHALRACSMPHPLPDAKTQVRTAERRRHAGPWTLKISATLHSRTLPACARRGCMVSSGLTTSLKLSVSTLRILGLSRSSGARAGLDDADLDLLLEPVRAKQWRSYASKTACRSWHLSQRHARPGFSDEVLSDRSD